MKPIVFCITCKDRTNHLKQTLPFNLGNTHPSSKFVVLDYNSQDDLLEYLKTSFHKEIECGRLVVYSYRDWPKFRMAHAKNMSHRLGIHEGGELLVNLDADNFVHARDKNGGPSFDEFVQRHFDNSDSFLWSRMIKGEMARGISGRIVVTRQQFLNAGGYDERFTTWSPDDRDFNARLRMLGYSPEEIPAWYLDAINHNDRVRFRDYPEARTEETAEIFNEASHPLHAIANYGRVGVGLVFKNFNKEDVVDIGPIATRIFGIGMHKTATTSLTHAIRMCGFQCMHWKSAHWAKAIYDEMTTKGTSPTIEKTYSACDLPIPLLFRELDRAYFGSSFILTVRDEDKWLRSVKRHWSYEHNPFRKSWDTDPFTNKVHTLLYGRRKFDAEVMLARYRQHNAEVLEYFKSRPNDLLVMDMDKGHGWNELCPFIGAPVPNVPYPREFVLSGDPTDYCI